MILASSLLSVPERRLSVRFFPIPAFDCYWPFDDPEDAKGSEEEKLVKFREIRDQIDAKIKQWLEDRRT